MFFVEIKYIEIKENVLIFHFLKINCVLLIPMNLFKNYQ